MADRWLPRCLVLAAALGLTLMAAGTGSAQPSEEDQGPVDQPRPLIAATASCHADAAEVQVIVYDDRAAPFAVHLNGGSVRDKRTTTFDSKHLVHVVTFPGLAAGEYHVTTETFDTPADGVRVAVRDCATLKPTDEPLAVEVECKAGWGTVTFQVANPKAGKQVRYTLTVDPPLTAHIVTLSGNQFVRITENGYEDRKHTAVLTGDGVNVTKEFTVACQSGNPAKLDIAVSACDGANAAVSVGLRNPNGVRVSYTVELAGMKKTVAAGGGERAMATFAGVASGDHQIKVTGSDKTRATGTATVPCAGATTTTTATSTTSTTTTAPVAQGRSGGGLALTGAVVGGLVGLGALALGLGGALLIIGRRRARQH
jgi:hypothetical protein